MSNNYKRTRSSSVYNNSDSDSSYSDDSDNDYNHKGSTAEHSNKKLKPLSKDQLYQLWTSFITTRPSHESDRATARALSKSSNYKMYTPRQISKKISYLKTLYKSKTPTTKSTKSTRQNEDSDGEYQVENYNYDDFDDEDDEYYVNDNVDSEDDNEDNDEENNDNNGSRAIVWDEETDLELLKLIKKSRHLFPSDVAFTDSIIKEKKFTKEGSHSQIKRRVSRLRYKHNITVPPPPPKPKKPIPEDRLEFWRLFKSIRANYTSDTDAIKKIMEGSEKFNKINFATLISQISVLKKQFGSSPDWVSKPRGGDTSNKNSSLTTTVCQPPLDKEEEEEQEEQNNNIKDRLKELKDKLQKYENENKGLKKQVGTLETKVTTLNNIIEKEEKEEKLSAAVVSSSPKTTKTTPYTIHLNDNTEITSSSSAVKIKSATYNDDIYILFPSFNGGNTKLRIVEIFGDRCHVEIKHVNTTFVNISNHFIKSIPGYHNPVSCLIKHDGINNTGLLLKRIIP